MKKQVYVNGNVVIHFQYGSTNSKTGDSVQVFIMPLKWITDGKSAMSDDKASCFDCIHSKAVNRTCYVRKGMAEMGLKSKVNSLHSAYLNGQLELLPLEDIATNESGRCTGAFVRFGAYGEPVLLGEKNIQAITSVASNWTSYTHQWRNPDYAWASKYMMASADTPMLQEIATGLGWRTFRVTAKNDTHVAKEVTCPASKEGGNKVQCNACGLCKGSSLMAKSIKIIKH